MAQLPQEVISENNFLMFTVTADGLNAQSASTAVLLEIIKDDVTTPVFSQAIYYGNYLESLDIDIGNINLAQGYDSSVSFRIEGGKLLKLSYDNVFFTLKCCTTLLLN